MYAERDQLSPGYPDPSFALDLTEHLELSNYPDPALGLLPAEEEEMQGAA